MKKIKILLSVMLVIFLMVGCENKTQVSNDSKTTTSENIQKEAKKEDAKVEENTTKTTETTDNKDTQKSEKQKDTNKEQKETNTKKQKKTTKKKNEVKQTKKKTNYSSLKNDINSMYAQDYGYVRIEKYDDMIELWFDNCTYETAESIRYGELTDDMIDTDYYYLCKAVIKRTGCKSVGMVISYDGEMLYQHGMVN